VYHIGEAWSEYAGETGVAVQSSKTRQVPALNNLMYFGAFHYTASGAVQYRTDLEMATFLRRAGGRIDNFVPAFNKRLTYCHEQEFRLAISLPGESRPETHLRLPVDLHDLIERIYVSSRAGASAKDVEEAVGRAGLTLAALRSTVYQTDDIMCLGHTYAAGLARRPKSRILGRFRNVR
jgi:hypothetical protein